MRVVLDTNVLISALITSGTPPDTLYRAWLRGDFDLVTSAAQIAEIADVASRPRLEKFIDADEAADILDYIGLRAIVLDDPPRVHFSPDPGDNPILAAGIAGNADMIVSGDKKHMLALAEIEGIPIVTAREALARLGSA